MSKLICVICILCLYCFIQILYFQLSKTSGADARSSLSQKLKTVIMEQEGAGGDGTHKLDYKIEKTAVSSLFGSDPKVYTFTGNSSQNISGRLFPEVGNGHVATQIGNEFMFMSGLYNGFETDSHRAAIPSTVGWHIEAADEPTAVWEYIFDTARGVFVHRCKLKNAEVQMRTYVRRDIPSIIVREVHALSLKSNLRLLIRNAPSFQSKDINLNMTHFPEANQMEGRITKSETEDSGETSVFVVFDSIPSEILLTPKKSSVYFLTSVNHNVATAWREFLESHASVANLFSDHVKRWLQLWNEGRVTTSGDLYLAQVTQTCQYYLLTSLPWPEWQFEDTWPFFGLSPSGLAHGNTEDDYLGHVFWDQETWMYPPIIPFHPKLAQHMSDYRYYALPMALEKAHSNGWEGAQYPWESAFTGVETSPWNLSANNEQHVIGDISFAISQFLWMKSSNDSQWYLSKGRRIIEEIARFWASRAHYNDEHDYYEIFDVMPPDEYVHCANNSVFTNYVAAFSMRAPTQLAKHFNLTEGPDYAKWTKIADKVFIPLNQTEPQFHPEIDGYKLGTKVKQADVILLGYPLEMEMPPWVRRNDLDVYENVTDPDGPAMTWSMFSVGRLDLQQYSQAWSTFNRSYDFVREPFKIWTEVRSGEGAVNFATGMGGFLQSLVNGYVGLRIRPNGLRFLPVLPPNANNICLYGIKYKGSIFNVRVERQQKSVFVQLVNAESSTQTVVLVTKGKRIELTRHNPVVRLPWEEMTLTVDEKN